MPFHSPPSLYGPGYAQLPNHGEDMRRLTDECTAARESARVLSEALIYTRPDELEAKPIIQVCIFVMLISTHGPSRSSTGNASLDTSPSQIRSSGLKPKPRSPAKGRS